MPLTGRAAELAAIAREVAATEPAWIGKVPGAGTAQDTPWMPFEMDDWVGMAWAALPEIEVSNRYLDVGCGPGTKMAVAEALFSWRARGFDRVPEYIAAATGQGLDAVLCDALAWEDWTGYGVVWFNRVYREPLLQQLLEARVWDGVSPGTVIMCAHLDAPPPASWFPVLDDWNDLHRGIWQKPVPSR